MTTLALVLVGAGTAAIPFDHLYDPLAFLPSEKVCRARHEIALRHVWELDMALDFWCGDCQYCYANGLAWDRLKAIKDRAEKYKAFWWACWWVRWPTATADQRVEWSERAIGLLGEDAYYNARSIPPIPPEQIGEESCPPSEPSPKSSSIGIPTR